MIQLSNIYTIYSVHPHGDEDDIHHMPVAKFLLTHNHFEVLEDHTQGRRFEKLASESPEKIASTIHRLANSMYYKVVNLQDVHDGHHPDLIPVHPLAEDSTGPESTFEYHRVGMPDAQTLEFQAGKGYLDGHLLEDKDLQLLHENVRAGRATLKHKQQQDPVQKAEEFFMTLTKIEPHLEQALQGLREAVKAGHVDPKVLKALTGEIFTDSMVPGLGNKKAYADFRSRPKQGVHVHMDGNDFGTINKIHGFETGNQAIVAMGAAMREAMDEAVGKKHGKLFRVGGDEFVAHVPSHDHAAAFARSLRQKLEAIPAVGGTHQLSVSMGFGHTPDHAELALINAKGEKKKAGYKLGEAKTHAASQVPGYEGVIPMGPEPLNLKPLPKPEPVVPATPAVAPPAPAQPEIKA